MTEAALLAAIADAMRAGEAAIDAVRVYGDWLQARADPRGELISVGCALEGADDPARVSELRRRQNQLRAQVVSELLGDASGHVELALGLVQSLWLELDEITVEQMDAITAHPAVAFVTTVHLSASTGPPPEHVVTQALAGFLSALEACEHLRRVELDQLLLSAEALRRLGGLGVRALSISACALADDALGGEWVDALADLDELSLDVRELPRAVIDRLPTLDRVGAISLDLPPLGSSQAWDDVRSLPPLAKLWLDSSGVDEAGLASVDDDLCRALSAHGRIELTLSFRSWEAPSIPHIERLTGLPNTGALNVVSAHLDDALADALARATRVDDLSLDFNIAEGDTLHRVIAAMPGLEWLLLSSFRASGEERDDAPIVRGLEAVGQLRKLDSLRLVLPLVDPAWLGFLPNLPALGRLSVESVTCDERLIDTLRACPRLSDVSLGGACDERWALALAALPRLRRASFTRSGLGGAARDRIRAALAHCDLHFWP